MGPGSGAGRGPGWGRRRRRELARAVPIALVLAAWLAVAAGGAARCAQIEISPALRDALELAGPERPVRVLVELAPPAPSRPAPGSPAPGSPRARMVRMRQETTAAARRLLCDLEGTCRVAPARMRAASYWLSSAVAVSLDRASIRELAARALLLGRVLDWLAPTPSSALARVALVDAGRRRMAASRHPGEVDERDLEELLLGAARSALEREPAREAVLAGFERRFGPSSRRLAADVGRELVRRRAGARRAD
jgi:hypothetical protein